MQILFYIVQFFKFGFDWVKWVKGLFLESFGDNRIFLIYNLKKIAHDFLKKVEKDDLIKSKKSIFTL